VCWAPRVALVVMRGCLLCAPPGLRLLRYCLLIRGTLDQRVLEVRVLEEALSGRIESRFTTCGPCCYCGGGGWPRASPCVTITVRGCFG
jgi:hypothetical protein